MSAGVILISSDPISYIFSPYGFNDHFFNVFPIFFIGLNSHEFAILLISAYFLCDYRDSLKLRSYWALLLVFH